MCRGRLPVFGHRSAAKCAMCNAQHTATMSGSLIREQVMQYSVFFSFFLCAIRSNKSLMEESHYDLCAACCLLETINYHAAVAIKLHITKYRQLIVAGDIDVASLNAGCLA